MRHFAEQAPNWDEQPGDLDGRLILGHWIHPDHPDDALDAAYCSGVVPEERRGLDDGWDALTILQARGRRLTKRIHRDGKIDAYDAAKRFSMTAMPVDGIDHLEETLRWLVGLQDRCVVRGNIAELGRATNVRRLLRADGAERPTLVDAPRRWLALDFDSLPRPDSVATSDLRACAKVAIATLPPEFHSVRHLAQATSSHGIKPGIRLRLWFWLDRPIGRNALSFWLRSTPVDQSLFTANQVTYTAAPTFIGRPDPIPERLIRIPGTAQVIVPPSKALRPPKRNSLEPLERSEGLSPQAGAILDRACDAIIAAPNQQQRKTMLRKAFAIGGLAASGAVPERLSRQKLLLAASQMPDRDPSDPWENNELKELVNHSFDVGMSRPWGTRS